tara:strand:- start:26 stop:349 length:324 start_codon:yes stop_codon:yes gene_type:complete
MSVNHQQPDEPLRGSFAAGPSSQITPHCQYQQFLAQNYPLPSPQMNEVRNVMHLMEINREDEGRKFISGIIERNVAHELIETPKILTHGDNPTVHRMPGRGTDRQHR